MLAKNFIAILAAAAGLATAIPAGSLTEREPASPVFPALAKRTTHSGRGTVYLQEGGTGSCGETNPDSSVIAAISNFWMDNESPGPFCGRKIKATNTGSNDGVGGAGNTVIVTVEDTCPSCGEGDVDFSVGAWDQLTNSAAYGTFDVTW
ncbi:MAG: hypothetical protein MMC33_006555 [Icmadophila ericetorum]|nr:hypothetical protein [Icmadophila ericetorum]